MMGPLHIDFFNQDHFLLNNVELRIKLIRNRDAFTLMSTAGNEKIKLMDATLYVRKVIVSPSVLLAHAQALEKAPAKYAVNRVDIKTVTIGQRLRDKNIDNLFMNQLPQRVVIGFVDNRGFNGDYLRNGLQPGGGNGLSCAWSHARYQSRATRREMIFHIIERKPFESTTKTLVLL